jgi:hypothetical protein
MQYLKVTSENLEYAASFSGGRIRGTKLPREDRIVQFDRQYGEEEARVGDFIVKFSNSENPYKTVRLAFSPEEFRSFESSVDWDAEHDE